MNAARFTCFAPAMGVRRPSEAETGSAGGTPGSLNLNPVQIRQQDQRGNPNVDP